MSTIESFKDRIVEIVLNNGPHESEYKELDEIINRINTLDEGKEFRQLISNVLENDTVFGHTFKKPFGYAGDFLLIEKIYQKYETHDPLFKRWDKFYHSHDATEAVRNRKSFFIKKVKELVTNQQQVDILILGCGPATDVYEFFSQTDQRYNIKFDLVDIDSHAIEYASEKNCDFLEYINFTRANVIKFTTEDNYDLIWSAGLFDYLDDQLFVFLLRRFVDNLKENGQIIIGNFSPLNPTIKVMEVMTEWHLNYRDEKHLKLLANHVGIDNERITVEKEPLGINLFLKIS